MRISENVEEIEQRREKKPFIENITSYQSSCVRLIVHRHKNEKKNH